MKKKINELIWDIAIVATASPELNVDGAICRGTTWFGKQLICVSSDLDPQTAKITITHELTHAFLWSTQMRRPDTFTEEEICDFFARWGSQIVNAAEEVYAELYDKEG